MRNNILLLAIIMIAQIELLYASDMPRSAIEFDVKENQNRQTAFRDAVTNGHVEIAERLLATENVDLNLRDNQGRTALDLANLLVFFEIIRVFENARYGYYIKTGKKFGDPYILKYNKKVVNSNVVTEEEDSCCVIQ